MKIALKIRHTWLLGPGVNLPCLCKSSNVGPMDLLRSGASDSVDLNQGGTVSV